MTEVTEELLAQVDPMTGEDTSVWGFRRGLRIDQLHQVFDLIIGFRQIDRQHEQARQVGR